MAKLPGFKMRAKLLPPAGILLLSACASPSSNVPPRYSTPLAAPPVVTPPVEPLLTIDPKKIPVPYAVKPDAPSAAKEYWQECQDAKINLITGLQQNLGIALQALQNDQPLGGPKLEMYDQLIKSDQAVIEIWKSQLKEACDPYFIVGASMWDAETGPGVIHGTIIQIVDDQNTLVDADFSYYHRSFGEHETVWISGYSTQDRVDGSPVVGCFISVGRTQYESALGKRTVHLFKPFNIRDYLVKQ